MIEAIDCKEKGFWKFKITFHCISSNSKKTIIKKSVKLNVQKEHLIWAKDFISNRLVVMQDQFEGMKEGSERTAFLLKIRRRKEAFRLLEKLEQGQESVRDYWREINSKASNLQLFNFTNNAIDYIKSFDASIGTENERSAILYIFDTIGSEITSLLPVDREIQLFEKEICLSSLVSHM